MTGGSRLITSEVVDYRMTMCVPSFRTTEGEFGSLREAGLPTLRTPGSSTQTRYPVGPLGLSSETAGGTSGSATIRVFFTCFKGVWSNRFLGRGWDARTTPMLYSLILCMAGYGLD